METTMVPSRWTTRSLGNAFTLVELLVVIGIVALLISVLLPALNKARASAMSVKCLSNLRQQGLAMLGYTSANQGRLPYGSLAGPGVSGPPIRTYSALIESRWLPPPTSQRLFHAADNQVQDHQSLEVLRCPAEPSFYVQGRMVRRDGRWRNTGTVWIPVGGGYSRPVGGVVSMYAFNLWTADLGGAAFVSAVKDSDPTQSVPINFGFGSRQYLPSQAHHKPAKSLARNSRSALTWMAFDASDQETPLAAIIFRHPGLSANFVYYDGHAESVRSSDINAKFHSGPNTNRFVAADERLVFELNY